MNALGAILVLASAAVAVFGLRKRVWVAAPFAAAALGVAASSVALTPPDLTATVLEVPLRLSALGRLAALVVLVTLLLLVLHSWAVEPAYNFFPSALAVGAATLAVLSVTTPLISYGALLIGLLTPVGSFVLHIERNRSVEAAVRHFAFVSLGGSLGLAALAVAASLPKDQPPSTFALLLVLLVVAFALKLAAIPFHTHAALLVTEAPAPALALYFGVLVPVTCVAFAHILVLSGLLPAVEQVQKAQDLLLFIGLLSALGGAFLASGARELRHLVVYGVISNLGASLVGMATLSGPGIVGAIAIAIVTGAAATQQLLAASALERAAGTDRAAGSSGRAGAARAPLAASAFIAGGAGMTGLPPLVAFPGHFFVEQIGYAFSPWTGSALIAATLLLLFAQLRAAIRLLSVRPDAWRVEPRPVGGAIGAVIFLALLAGGIVPDTFLRPIVAFADEFLRALRPL